MQQQGLAVPTPEGSSATGPVALLLAGDPGGRPSFATRAGSCLTIIVKFPRALVADHRVHAQLLLLVFFHAAYHNIQKCLCSSKTNHWALGHGQSTASCHLLILHSVESYAITSYSNILISVFGVVERESYKIVFFPRRQFKDLESTGSLGLLNSK